MASKGDAGLFILFVLGISLAGSYVVVYGSLLLDGLTEDETLVENTRAEPWHETILYEIDVVANASAIGRCAYIEQRDVMRDRPGDFTGLFLEATLRSVADEPLVQQVRILVYIDDVLVAEAANMDNRGVLTLLVEPDLWPAGRLSIGICPPAYEKTPNALALTRVYVYATFFHGGPLDPDFTAVPESGTSQIALSTLHPLLARV